jgi:hypothetical protein
MRNQELVSELYLEGDGIMTYKDMLELLNGYYEEDSLLDSELDYVASKHTYGEFGLAVKEAYLEYTEEFVYDE